MLLHGIPDEKCIAVAQSGGGKGMDELLCARG